MFADLVKATGEGRRLAEKVGRGGFHHFKQRLRRLPLHRGPDLDCRARWRRRGQEMVNFFGHPILKPGTTGAMGVRGLGNEHDSTGESIQSMDHVR